MNNDFLIPIGKRIAEIRRSNHVTQEALANELGVSPKHISKLPPEITQILSTGTDADIDRLNRYLQVYIELLNAND